MYKAPSRALYLPRSPREKNRYIHKHSSNVSNIITSRFSHRVGTGSQHGSQAIACSAWQVNLLRATTSQWRMQTSWATAAPRREFRSQMEIATHLRNDEIEELSCRCMPVSVEGLRSCYQLKTHPQRAAIRAQV